MSGHDTIVILDFGSQYTQLIARSIRLQGVYSLILPCHTPLAEIKALAPSGIILSGGPASVTGAESPRCDPGVFALGAPILGICYGMQLIAHERGGKVAAGNVREYGRARIRLSTDSPLFAGLDEVQEVWMSHGDRVETIPAGFRSVAVSEGTGTAAADLYGHSVALESADKRTFAVQFHPEVHHTPHGGRILGNFVIGICRCRADWTAAAFVEESIAAIRKQVGSGKVILGYSGGVDSSIAAVLLHRAIGDALIPVFVDNGLLRLNEREEVRTRFEAEFGIKLRVHDYSAEFLSALKGVTEPEAKRKIIGKHFIDAFSAALRKEKAAAGDVEFLAQGTLYPDVIESLSASGGPSATIKTHHNVGGLPEDLKFKLVEPLRWLFKDDVRRVGRELGVPEDLVGRHPFPGPGLAVRCLGELTPARLQTLREADAIFIEELRKAGQYDRTAQALAVLLPVKSVGVMGDARTYEEVVALRAVTTQDFMTADWADLPRDLLARVSNRIINEVKGVNRVVYDISSKPPATIEWE